ncbi:formate dehydrogenase subunit gamma [Rhodoligotrophos appendicifer]|uniref:formate dehydrogenase subunit gamma n=1 Tax=Rhodoligotrophos appendicifer TaxID=987056 RepID=UPI001184806A|nr:formate dehydrogenase subunit gamma [Rhodoligotrophos appendicifer]
MRPGNSPLIERVMAVVERHKPLEGPLLPILHGLQDEFGYVPVEALPLIAEALNISRAEVHGVFTFYHDFRHQPAGRHILKLCQAEACQAMGSDHIRYQLESELGIGLKQTARDNSVTFEPVYCLGLCACAPAAMLDGEMIGRIDAKRVAEIIQAVRS